MAMEITDDMASGIKWVLTDEQITWLKENFHNTMNCECAEYLGISMTAVHRFARQYGLKKSKEGFKKIMLENGKKIQVAKRRNNSNPPKGYQIPKGDQYRFKKGVSNYEGIGRERTKELLNDLHKRNVEARRIDRARVMFGLPQLSKLNVKRQPQQKIYDRCYLKRLGYIIDEENLIAYWTPQTKRAVKLEKRPRRFYHFREYVAV